MTKFGNLALTFGFAMGFSLLNTPIYAQRNLLENIGRSILNEAINGSRPPKTSPPQQPQPKYQQRQVPNESGTTPGGNPYGGQWGQIIQPQPQPRVTPQPRIQPQPRTYPRTYPLGGRRNLDAYAYLLLEMPVQSRSSSPKHSRERVSSPSSVVRLNIPVR